MKTRPHATTDHLTSDSPRPLNHGAATHRQKGATFGRADELVMLRMPARPLTMEPRPPRLLKTNRGDGHELGSSDYLQEKEKKRNNNKHPNAPHEPEHSPKQKLNGRGVQRSKPHQVHHNPRFALLNGGLAPERTGQREDQKARANVRRLTREAETRTNTRRKRERQAAGQTLNGREGEEETRTTPTTKGNGRRGGRGRREKITKTQHKQPPARQASPATDTGQANQTTPDAPQRFTRGKQTKQGRQEERETDATDVTCAGKFELAARKHMSRV